MRAPARLPHPAARAGAAALACAALAWAALACVALCPAGRAAAQTAPPAPPAPPAAAAPTPAAPRTLRAVFVRAAPHVDGRLDDAAWAAAPASGDFTQRAPRAGLPATERTEVRVVYDRDALYVAVRCFDARPDLIGRQLARRDPDGIYSDWVHVGIDSYRDRRTGFRFSLNPRGVQGDGFLFDDTEEDALWDAVWTGAARVDARGWAAELRVPFSQLRFSRAALDRANGALPAGAWGFNVVREVARTGEEAWWAPTPPDAPGVVSRFGTLAGLDSLGAPSTLELVPYARTQLTTAPTAGDPLARPRAGAAAAGLDLRWRLPHNLTLSASANPDFGQVEADPAVVNLTQFEVFFPERRPFFLEGVDAFRFGTTTTLDDDDPPTFFYTRRIGRAPSRRPSGADVRASAVPPNTRILTAAKVSGKTPGGWSVGALAAVTGAERARVLGADGRLGTAPAEPAGGYGIARVRRDFRGGNTVVGGVATLAARDAAGPFAALLPRRSLVAGLDFDHAWRERTFTVSGVAAGSRVAGAPALVARLQRAPYRLYQRVDAGHLAVDTARTALSGHFASLSAAKLGGRHWIGSATYEETAPGFEVNDLGFQQRSDERALAVSVAYREQQQAGRGAGRHFRNYFAGLFATGARNFAGDVLARRLTFYGEAQTANFWELSVEAGRSGAAFDDRLTRGGPLARVPARWRAEWEVRSDTRRRVILAANGELAEDGAGRWTRGLGLEADVRPAGALRVRVEPYYERGRQVDQYVASADDSTAAATFGRRVVFGRLVRDELNVTARVDWTFTPFLSLQLFAQPFAAAGRFGGFATFARPGAFAFAPLAVERAGGRVLADPDGAGPARAVAFDEPDYALRSLRGNAVVRWEYRPGSAVFLVWQQQRASARDAALGPLGALPGAGGLARDAGRALTGPGTHVFLVKVSHWLGR